MFRSDVLHAYIYTSDAGPDQIGCRSLLKRFVFGNTKQGFAFDFSCMKHQLQLISQKSLVAADSICKAMSLPHGYFSTVAKLMHLWRDPSNFDKLFEIGRRLYSDCDALEYLQKRPPRCIAGRWHSVDDCEKMLLKSPLLESDGKVSNVVFSCFAVLLDMEPGVL
jgi:hypothetical protein